MKIPCPPAVVARPARPWRCFVGGLWAGSLCLLVACQASTGIAHAQAPGRAPATEAELLAAIHAEVGQAPCRDDSQCRTLGLGAKACGGPASWLPWSTATAQEKRLLAWAHDHAALQRQRQADSGMVSNCRYLADPGAQCLGQHCVLRHGQPMHSWR